MSQRIQALRGMNDVLPADAPAWRRFHAAVQQAMDAYGYQQIRLPVMEATELFKRSVGDTSDIVEKEMFTFLDREKTSMSLRPEGTASCVRAGIEHGLLHNQQQRLWYEGPMFRHERPQAGRYRQFHQIGVEAFGFAGPEADVEVIALSASILRALGLLGVDAAGLRLELNSLGTPAARATHRQALVAFLERHAAALDEDSRRRMQSNPLRVFDSKVPQTQAVMRDAPVLPDYLDDESRAHFAQVRAGLDALGIAYVLNPRLVRGLDYYTRTVFEWTTEQLGAQGTICAGGRYDGLVAQLGGGDVPATGFAMGIERTVQLCAKAGAGRAIEGAAQAYVCWLGEEAWLPALRLAEELRHERGLRVVLNAGGGNLKAQLKRADRSGAAFALILGGDEVARRCAQLKPLRNAQASQEALGWDELPAALAARLDSPA